MSARRTDSSRGDESVPGLTWRSAGASILGLLRGYRHAKNAEQSTGAEAAHRGGERERATPRRRPEHRHLACGGLRASRLQQRPKQARCLCSGRPSARASSAFEAKQIRSARLGAGSNPAPIYLIDPSAASWNRARLRAGARACVLIRLPFVANSNLPDCNRK